MEAHYIGFNMWVKAVEAAGTTDTDAVIEAMDGVAVPNLTGGLSSMSVEPPHHQAGAASARSATTGSSTWSGRRTAWCSGDEWSDYLPESADLIANWRAPMSCGNFNAETGECGGATN